MLNVAAVMGRFVADPELKHTPNNIAVTSFTLAVDRSYQKSGTERQADFIDVVAWRGTAEFVCKYFSKGKMIAVEGSIQTRNYEDKNGNKRKAVEILANNVSFAGSKNDDSGNSNNGNRRNTYEPAVSPSAPPPSYGYSSPSFTEEDYEETIMSDDDLPF